MTPQPPATEDLPERKMWLMFTQHGEFRGLYTSAIPPTLPSDGAYSTEIVSAAAAQRLVAEARAEGARHLAMQIQDMASGRTTEVIWKIVHEMEARTQGEGKI